MKLEITELEKKMLAKIARSEYTPINGAEPDRYQDCETWADIALESKEDGGVFSSLVKKGLASHSGSGKDAGVYLTEQGFVAYKQTKE